MCRCARHRGTSYARHRDTPQAYSSPDRTIDSFVSINTKSLIVFSAGNEGAKGFGSINKACKNCIMVGATQQSDSLFRSMSPYIDPGWFCTFVGSNDPCCANRLTCTSQCCNWLNRANMSLACCKDQTTCSAKTCSVESGNIRSAINVASFSALGPTADGRFKPDLVTTGEDTLSAATPSQTSPPFTFTAPNHCINTGGSTTPRSSSDDFNSALKTLSGTSMSTPLMAGGTEKIRQCATAPFPQCIFVIFEQVLCPRLLSHGHRAAQRRLQPRLCSCARRHPRIVQASGRNRRRVEEFPRRRCQLSLQRDILPYAHTVNVCP